LCPEDYGDGSVASSPYCRIKMIKYIEYDKLIEFKKNIELILREPRSRDDNKINNLIGPIKKTINFLSKMENIVSKDTKKPEYVCVDIKKDSCIPLLITQALMFYLS
jgi:hypothetical protein